MGAGTQTEICLSVREHKKILLAVSCPFVHLFDTLVMRFACLTDYCIFGSTSIHFSCPDHLHQLRTVMMVFGGARFVGDVDIVEVPDFLAPRVEAVWGEEQIRTPANILMAG